MKQSVLILSAMLMLLMSGCSAQPVHHTDARSGTWVRVDKQAYWENDSVFQSPRYFPPVAFEYPSDWQFSCCGDTGAGSYHWICSDDSFKNGWCEANKAYVTLFEWSLSGCPSGKWDCSIENIVSKTAEQKYNDEVHNIRANTGTLILPETHLLALGADAFVYAKNDRTRSYLINLGENVIDVEFALSEIVDNDFIADFFSRLVWDKE